MLCIVYVCIVCVYLLFCNELHLQDKMYSVCVCVCVCQHRLHDKNRWVELDWERDDVDIQRILEYVMGHLPALTDRTFPLHLPLPPSNIPPQCTPSMIPPQCFSLKPSHQTFPIELVLCQKPLSKYSGVNVSQSELLSPVVPTVLLVSPTCLALQVPDHNSL
jgi:hypothetical protein